MFARIKYLIKRRPKTIAASLLVSLAIVVPVAVYAGFGPSRPTYDWNKYNASVSCTDPSNAYGRCGSMNGPVFDSFINTPSYGDEENFNRIAPVVAGQSPVDANFSETNTATPGQEYWVRTFVHNDANQNLNCLPAHDSQSLNDCTQIDPGSPSIATGTNVRVAIAPGTANGVDVMSYISAANSNPGTVYDSSTLTNPNQAFSVSYVNGSAVIYNSAHTSGLALPDAIASSTGTPIGYQNMDGVLPGCFNFSAYVYVKVQVQSPALKVVKQVRANSTAAWSSSINANKGDQVQWKITFQDTGNSVDNNLTIRDPLPKDLSMVPGSVKWYDNANNGTVQSDTALSAGGVNFGNYAPSPSGINGEVVFNTNISSNPSACTITNVGYGRATNVPETSSTATVNINNCNTPPPPPPPPTPTYSCDLLNVSKNGQTVTITDFNHTQTNGATFKDAVIDWGDNSQDLTTNNVIGQTHQYTGNGPFNISAVASFTVNGQTKTPDNNKCLATVSFTSTPTPPAPTPTPTTPTALVNTGPGSFVAIFAGTTIFGAIAHRLFSGRRANRNS
jgi:uncharacterized repeat protein (TIGR01451 family)